MLQKIEVQNNAIIKDSSSDYIKFCQFIEMLRLILHRTSITEYGTQVASHDLQNSYEKVCMQSIIHCLILLHFHLY